MSVYSTDSLEDANETSPRSQDYENSFRSNIVPIETLTELSPNVSLHLKSTIRNQGKKGNSGNHNAGSNETTPGMGTDKDTRTAGSRNAIIANGGFADASKRQRLALSRNGKRDVTNRLQRNKVDSPTRKDGSTDEKVAPTYGKKTHSTNRRRCSKETPMPMKPDKKLRNVLTPRVQPSRKPRSYLEFYRRRFSGPRYNVRSPEGSTLSVCGDSQRDQQLSDDDTCLPVSPRDDRSELSFYRRLIRSTENNVHQRVSDDPNSSLCLDRVKRNATADKSKKVLGYRPYTIEEYKTLSIPKLDRSLGPDKVEMQEKREWLTRRRSYGNSVSAHNRQRIVLQARKLQSKHGISETCFLPALKDQEVDAKTQVDSVASTISEEHGSAQKNNSTNCSRYSKKIVDVGKISSSRKSKKFQRTSSFCSSLNSRDIIEDSYLESLRQRHLREKEMLDRMINQALYP